MRSKQRVGALKGRLKLFPATRGNRPFGAEKAPRQYRADYKSQATPFCRRDAIGGILWAGGEVI